MLTFAGTKCVLVVCLLRKFRYFYWTSSFVTSHCLWASIFQIEWAYVLLKGNLYYISDMIYFCYNTENRTGLEPISKHVKVNSSGQSTIL